MSLARSSMSGLTLGLLCVLAAGSEGCGKRDTAGNDVIGNVPGIVFAKRANYDKAGNPQVSGGSGQVIDYLRYVPGGGVYTLFPPRADGKLENITAKFPDADVNGIDVSFDAKQVVFSMKKTEADHYHVYTANIAADGSGDHAIKQLTFGDTRDDVMPIFIPGDRVAFVTNEPYTAMGTRADEYEHARVVSQIATISVTGGDADRKLCAQNLSHTVNLWLRFDGTIGFSRWEHLGNVNDVKLFKMNPDCTQMLSVAGQFNKPVNSLVQVHEIAPNVMVGIGTKRNRTLQAGALMRIDARYKDPKTGNVTAEKLDSDHASFVNLTPGVPAGGGSSPIGRYRTPSHLPDGRLLVSWADGWMTDQNELEQVPPNFGIYVYDEATKANVLVYDDPKSMELYAQPIVARNVPPVIGDLNKKVDPSTPAVIGSIDVIQTNLVENVSGAQFKNVPLSEALKSAVAVRVIEGFSSEIGALPMFGLTMHEGGAILGEVPVQSDGSWLASIPPFLPVHLQPIDKFGMSIRNQLLWIQGMPGETRTCGGCHEARAEQVLPRKGIGLTIAQQKGPQNLVKPIKDREEYGWNTQIQPILDAKCVSCHGSDSALAKKTYQVIATDEKTGKTTTYTIPWLDLSGDSVSVSFEMGVYTFSKSYVSLYYPSQLKMGSRGLKVVGDLPPEWMVPGDARNSKLIQHINVKADDGTLAWAGTTEHDVDKGKALTKAEKAALIKSADLGGQWTSRQNVKNATCWKSDAADKGTCSDAKAGGGTIYP